MSSTHDAGVDTDHFSVRRSVHIDAGVDKVWAAITEPDHISRWFGLTSLDGPGPHASGTITFEGHGTVPLVLVGSEHHRSVTYRWNNDDAGTIPDSYDAAHATEFTFSLEPADGGVQLTVEETGFDVTSNPSSNMRAHAAGWTDQLDSLVAFLAVAP